MNDEKVHMWFALILIMAFFSIGIGLGYWSATNEMKREAIKAGAARYDDVTGSFTWGEK